MALEISRVIREGDPDIVGGASNIFTVYVLETVPAAGADRWRRKHYPRNRNHDYRRAKCFQSLKGTNAIHKSLPRVVESVTD